MSIGSDTKKLARRVLVSDLKILELGADKTSGEIEYRPLKQDGRGIYPDYPILIAGNGLPWTLGNIYLLKRLESTRNYEPKTWQNLALDLLHYLRWLESTDTNPLFFSTKQKFARPTYKYRNYLIEQVNEGKMASSTAAGRMSAIVNFYRGLVAHNILSNEILNLGWEERQVLIKVVDKDLQSKLYTISSTDLAIKKPPRTENGDYIRDGGQLRPLSENEQRLIAEQLKEASANYRLIFAFAILTGARLQTICTLRGATLDNAIFDKDNNRYLISIGGQGHMVDTKGGKRHVIVLPAKLYQLLTHHWNSSESIDRRLRSFYGNVENNYLFLTKDGQPYITSKREKIDRRDPDFNRRVSLGSRMAGNAKSRNGQAIWAFINNTLIPSIRKKHPEFKSFSFHDLRATFGMNLLEALLRLTDRHNTQLKEQGIDRTYGTEWVLEQVQERMGHSNLSTTMRYLNFRRNQQFKASLQVKIEDELMKYVPENTLEYDDE